MPQWRQDCCRTKETEATTNLATPVPSSLFQHSSLLSYQRPQTALFPCSGLLFPTYLWICPPIFRLFWFEPEKVWLFRCLGFPNWDFSLFCFGFLFSVVCCRFSVSCFGKCGSSDFLDFPSGTFLGWSHSGNATALLSIHLRFQNRNSAEKQEATIWKSIFWCKDV